MNRNNFYFFYRDSPEAGRVSLGYNGASKTILCNDRIPFNIALPSISFSAKENVAMYVLDMLNTMDMLDMRY